MADILRGRASSQKNLPDEVIEFMVAHETGWSLSQIRNMKSKDRRAVNIMSQFSYMAKMQKTSL